MKGHMNERILPLLQKASEPSEDIHPSRGSPKIIVLGIRMRQLSATWPAMERRTLQTCATTKNCSNKPRSVPVSLAVSLSLPLSLSLSKPQNEWATNAVQFVLGGVHGTQDPKVTSSHLIPQHFTLFNERNEEKKKKPSVLIPVDVSKAMFPEVTSVLLSGSLERKKVSDSGREKKSSIKGSKKK